MTVVIIIGIIIVLIWLVSKMSKINSDNQTNYNTYSNEYFDQDDPIEELFEDLTMQQKHAIMVVYALIAGRDSTGNIYDNVEGKKIIGKAENLLDMTIKEAIEYTHTHNPKELCSVLSSIQHKALSDFLLVDYFRIIELMKKSEDKEKAYTTMVYLYQHMGYTENDIIEAMKKMSALMNSF